MTKKTKGGALRLLISTLVLLLTAAPSNTATQPRHAPDPHAIARLKELAGWARFTLPEVPTPDVMARAVRDRPESFEVFRTYLPAAERAAHLADLPYGRSILRAAAAHGVDALLVASVVEVESGFDPRALSWRGAAGLMQVLPSTASLDGPGPLFEPVVNLDYGTAYLAELLERFGGDLILALAAYNAGPTNVRRHGGLPPFRETHDYVEKVLARYVAHHQEAWRTDAGALLQAAL